MNLATNIVAITPKKNRPANADIVSYVTDSLVRQEEAVPVEVPGIGVGTTEDYPTPPFVVSERDILTRSVARQVGESMITQTVQTGEMGLGTTPLQRAEFRSGGFAGSRPSLAKKSPAVGEALEKFESSFIQQLDQPRQMPEQPAPQQQAVEKMRPQPMVSSRIAMLKQSAAASSGDIRSYFQTQKPQ